MTNDEISDSEKYKLGLDMINELITPAGFVQMVNYMCEYARKKFPMESLYLTTHAPIHLDYMDFRFWKGRPKISEDVHPDIGTQTDKFLGRIRPNRSKAMVLEGIIRERYGGVTIVKPEDSWGEIKGDWSPCEPKAERDRGCCYSNRYCMQTTLYELVKGEK